jgi:stearoyl-CoA desaturase (delta-9 desaturase)
MGAFHIGAVAALFMFTWTGLLACGLVWLIAGLGVGSGFHRLLTHRGYKTPKWLEYLFTICGALALQGGPIWWVARHRVHHKFTEIQGLDPHTPRDGRFWSHMGWLMYKDTAEEKKSVRLYAPELLRDKFHRWLQRLHVLPFAIVGGVLFLLGGWPLALWATCVPITIGWHSTWLVNSATHLWGSRRFATTDDSRNNWWVALLTFGEGWHNNHHAHPTSARHGLAWYELDITWLQIRALQLIGIARSVKVAKVDAELREAA